jgi:ABC-type transport system involved in cytochrome bd biosynthesis fused ATPase/permease subunit
MKRFPFLLAGGIVLLVLFFLVVPSSRAQSEEEKKFMKEHQQEMTTFMNKCSGCHSLQRIFAKKRSREEWTKILKNMAAMPHAMITQEELQKIQKWIDLMQAALIPGP